ncbi:MAG: hypothetical protein RIR48_446 [Bacteroidota bacterium]
MEEAVSESDSEKIKEALPQILDGLKEYMAHSARRSKNSPFFVNGVIKIIGHEGNTLTIQEAEAVKVFKRESTPAIQNLGVREKLSIEEEARRINEAALANRSGYDDVSWIPATTCEVERFFSQCKLNHSDKRVSLTNDNLEMIMFLKCHKWTIETVEKALKAEKKAE